ncbi:MAG: HigA family addiction module antitoxin [Acidobacteriaceae bacterium]
MSISETEARALHPGEILREEFLRPIRLSPEELSSRLNLPTSRITELLQERVAIDADIAVRLARFFQTSSAFWMELQATYELAHARVGIAELVSNIQPFGSELIASAEKSS